MESRFHLKIIFLAGIFQVAETMGSSIEVLREQMIFLLEQGLHDSAEMLVCVLTPGFMVLNGLFD